MKTINKRLVGLEPWSVNWEINQQACFMPQLELSKGCPYISYGTMHLLKIIFAWLIHHGKFYQPHGPCSVLLVHCYPCGQVVNHQFHWVTAEQQ